MANQNEVAQVIAMIGSAYPNFSPTKETVGVYYELLKDLPLDLLRAASLKCCAEAGRKFAPSVGEVRGAAGEIERKANGVPSALEAWGEVCGAPKSGGQKKITDEIDEQGRVVVVFYPHKWSHPLVERVACLLGFPNFPIPGNETVDRAHFLKQYEIEMQARTSDAVELPAVTEYIEARKVLAVGEEMKRLAERVSK